ncbi:MAG TPA: hypothetical protein VMG31_15855 [Verrucomicrobiae bacterium]|nr:hypothetical protein [Verrucomicrobiae bacterium]
MKILAAGVLFLLLVTGSALSQNGARLEVFGGYSAEHIAPCGTVTTYGQGFSCGLEEGELQSSNIFIHGWEAAMTGYVDRFVGFTADFATHYHAFDQPGDTRYSFLFGPTVAVPLPKITPFAHALFGVVKETESLGASSAFTAPEIALGGGVDVKVSRRFAVRIAQIDYEWQRNPTSGLPHPSGMRYGGGIVFKF